MFDQFPSPQSSWWSFEEALVWICESYKYSERGDVFFEATNDLTETHLAKAIIAHGSIDGSQLNPLGAELWESVEITPYWRFDPPRMKIYEARFPEFLIRSTRAYPAKKVRYRSEPFLPLRHRKASQQNNQFHIIISNVALKSADVIRTWPAKLSPKQIDKRLNTPRRRAGRMDSKIAETLPQIPVRGGGSLLLSPSPLPVPKIARMLIGIWAETGDDTVYELRTVERAVHRYYSRRQHKSLV